MDEQGTRLVTLTECQFSGKSQGGKSQASLGRTSYHAYPARGIGAAAADRGRASDDPPLQRSAQGVPMDGAVAGGDRKFYQGEHRGKTYQSMDVGQLS